MERWLRGTIMRRMPRVMRTDRMKEDRSREPDTERDKARQGGHGFGTGTRE